ncbi:MAG: sugar phosphate isomerase/epimerase [Cyclobacteriaceae bacterium]|nr:sugar phosphate isomerase/epimerase [Cyclobacteriaceae bacterium]
MDRRDFLQRSTLMTGSALFGHAMAAHSKDQTVPGYSLKIMATRWGFKGTLDDFCKAAREAGYDGIEDWLPSRPEDVEPLLNACAKHGLDYGFLVAGHSSDFNEHYKQFEDMLHRAVAHKPLFINCHSGKDFFSFEQNKKLMDLTSKAVKSSGVRIYHETHRGRALFAAHITRSFIENIYDLRLTLDISHWCNVHESLLDNQKDTIDLALDRTDHIHSRIGHPESPQVTDPRAPEWDKAVKAHVAWWDKVAEQKKKSGQLLTVTSEFGPATYMPTVPFTGQPLANQWEINVYMKDFFRERYG